MSAIDDAIRRNLKWTHSKCVFGICQHCDWSCAVRIFALITYLLLVIYITSLLCYARPCIFPFIRVHVWKYLFCESLLVDFYPFSENVSDREKKIVVCASIRSSTCDHNLCSSFIGSPPPTRPLSISELVHALLYTDTQQSIASA